MSMYDQPPTRWAEGGSPLMGDHKQSPNALLTFAAVAACTVVGTLLFHTPERSASPWDAKFIQGTQTLQTSAPISYTTARTVNRPPYGAANARSSKLSRTAGPSVLSNQMDDDLDAEEMDTFKDNMQAAPRLFPFAAEILSLLVTVVGGTILYYRKLGRTIDEFQQGPRIQVALLGANTVNAYANEGTEPGPITRMDVTMEERPVEGGAPEGPEGGDVVVSMDEDEERKILAGEDEPQITTDDEDDSTPPPMPRMPTHKRIVGTSVSDAHDEEIPEPSLSDMAKLTYQNLMQFGMPTTWDDNIPPVPLEKMWRLGAINMNMSDIGPSWVADFFTGGFQDITGVPVFVLLDRYLKVSPIYKLCIGPRSIVVVSDAIAAKQILKAEVGQYDKGILAYILKPIMGKGLIPADPVTWKIRRRAIKPAFHKKWLQDMMGLYTQVSMRLIDDLGKPDGEVVDMQERFCSASLDIIGKAVFNYEFGSITRESPVIKAVYAVLREAERRASSVIPYWELPGGRAEFDGHMRALDDVLNSLVLECMKDQDDGDDDDENTDLNISLLRFLVEMRGQDVTGVQLRDDLMTMLIAGHETSAATLTWALHELTKPENAKLMAEVRSEVDAVMGETEAKGGVPGIDEVKQMRLVRMCISEALRLYPAPPLLIRRCLKEHHIDAVGFPDGITVAPGQDIMITTWSMQRDPRLWGENSEVFEPHRFDHRVLGSDEYQLAGWNGYDPAKVRGLYPDESTTDFGFLPFGGGGRKCVGDEFAMLETTVMLATALRHYEFEPAKDIELGMGATIFSKTGLQMKVTRRTNEQKAASAAAWVPAPTPSRGPAGGAPAGKCPMSQ